MAHKAAAGIVSGDPSALVKDVEKDIANAKKKVQDGIERREKKLLDSLNGEGWKIKVGNNLYHLECPRCGEEKMHEMYFFPSTVDDNGLICCTACSDWFRRWIRRAEISVGKAAKLSRREYNADPMEDWAISFARSTSLMQFAKDYGTRKRKVSPAAAPRKSKVFRSKAKKKKQKRKAHPARQLWMMTR